MLFGGNSGTAQKKPKKVVKKAVKKAAPKKVVKKVTPKRAPARSSFSKTSADKRAAGAVARSGGEAIQGFVGNFFSEK